MASTISKLLTLLLIAASATSITPVMANESGKSTVIIEDFEFKPEKLTIKKGESVRFTNKDSTPHTVSPANSGKFVGTGRLLKNETKTLQFTRAGKYDYFCDFHPSMKGTITVTE